MVCDICGRTDKECNIRNIKGMSLCPRHVTQYYRHHSFNDNTIYQPNEYVIHDTYAEILLKNKKCEIVNSAMIDLDDVEKCKQYKWHLRKGNGETDYVIASLPNNQKIHLHRFIMGCDKDHEVDHINFNGLDNRKNNLRVVSHSENKSNNRFTGIYKVKSGRYRASICRNYKTIYIGTYDTFEEAKLARNDYINSMQLVS